MGEKKVLGEGTKAGGDAVSESGKHSMHGADGSHQDSRKLVGGARERILTGHPSEMIESDGDNRNGKK